MIDGSITISLYGFFPAFQMACSTNDIHECAAMWLFHFFMKKPPGAALNARTYLCNSKHALREKKMTPHCKVVKCFLSMHATEDIITSADMCIMHFKQHTGQSTVEYAQALWTKALVSAPTKDEYRLNITFNERLKQSIRKCFQRYWDRTRLASLQEPARHAPSLANQKSCKATPQLRQPKSKWKKRTQLKWRQYLEYRVRLNF